MILQRDITKKIASYNNFFIKIVPRHASYICLFTNNVMLDIHVVFYLSLSLQSSAVTSRFMAYRLLNLFSTLFYPRPFLSAVHMFHLPQYHVTNLCYSYGAPLVPVQQILLSGGNQIIIWWPPHLIWCPPDSYLVATR